MKKLLSFASLLLIVLLLGSCDSFAIRPNSTSVYVQQLETGAVHKWQMKATYVSDLVDLSHAVSGEVLIWTDVDPSSIDDNGRVQVGNLSDGYWLIEIRGLDSEGEEIAHATVNAEVSNGTASDRDNHVPGTEKTDTITVDIKYTIKKIAKVVIEASEGVNPEDYYWQIQILKSDDIYLDWGEMTTDTYPDLDITTYTIKLRGYAADDHSDLRYTGSVTQTLILKSDEVWPFVFSLDSGTLEEHVHSWAVSYANDDEHHWQILKCTLCGHETIAGLEAHTLGDISSEYRYDESGHWHYQPCTNEHCNYEKSLEKEEHSLAYTYFFDKEQFLLTVNQICEVEGCEFDTSSSSTHPGQSSLFRVSSVATLNNMTWKQTEENTWRIEIANKSEGTEVYWRINSVAVEEILKEQGLEVTEVANDFITLKIKLAESVISERFFIECREVDSGGAIVANWSSHQISLVVRKGE